MRAADTDEQRGRLCPRDPALSLGSDLPEEPFHNSDWNSVEGLGSPNPLDGFPVAGEPCERPAAFRPRDAVDLDGRMDRRHDSFLYLVMGLVVGTEDQSSRYPGDELCGTIDAHLESAAKVRAQPASLHGGPSSPLAGALHQCSQCSKEKRKRRSAARPINETPNPPPVAPEHELHTAGTGPARGRRNSQILHKKPERGRVALGRVGLRNQIL